MPDDDTGAGHMRRRIAEWIASLRNMRMSSSNAASASSPAYYGRLALWLAVLILPGGFFVLPLVLWWSSRRQEPVLVRVRV